MKDLPKKRNPLFIRNEATTLTGQAETPDNAKKLTWVDHLNRILPRRVSFLWLASAITIIVFIPCAIIGEIHPSSSPTAEQSVSIVHADETSTSASDTGSSGTVSVEASAWDGSVSQVKDWLKSNLKDPSSLEIIEWSPVVATSSGHSVRCKYRAKNSFGAYDISNQIFDIDFQGNVTVRDDGDGN